jgi:hypothetical protein
VFGDELDFRVPATSDHYAGPGWWAVDEYGLWSHGAEARVIVDVPEQSGDLELEIDARSFDSSPRCVEVRVNERVVARVEVVPGDVAREVRLRVPASVARRFRPMEIAFLAAPNATSRRRVRVGVRLLRVCVRPFAG